MPKNGKKNFFKGFAKKQFLDLELQFWAILDFFKQTGLLSALYPPPCVKTEKLLQKILKISIH